VVGERAALEGGVRTATLRATTRARVAETSAEQLDRLGLDALAATHRREEQPV
jgi:CRP-like cAMP-binding protein